MVYYLSSVGTHNFLSFWFLSSVFWFRFNFKSVFSTNEWTNESKIPKVEKKKQKSKSPIQHGLRVYLGSKISAQRWVVDFKFNNDYTKKENKWKLHMKAANWFQFIEFILVTLNLVTVYEQHYFLMNYKLWAHSWDRTVARHKINWWKHHLNVGAIFYSVCTHTTWAHERLTLIRKYF